MSRCGIFTVLLAKHSKAGKSPFHIWKICFTGVTMPKAMELVCHICSQWINTKDCNEVPLPLIYCRLLSTLHECSLACVQWMSWMSALFIICCTEGKDLVLRILESCIWCVLNCINICHTFIDLAHALKLLLPNLIMNLHSQILPLLLNSGVVDVYLLYLKWTWNYPVITQFSLAGYIYIYIYIYIYKETFVWDFRIANCPNI